jgi:hypothetical protein
MILAAILEGFKAWFDDSDLPALAGGLFYGTAPRGETLPYVTYALVDGGTEDDMSSSVEDVLIQVSVWSEQDSPTEAIAIGEQIALLYDNAELAVSSGTCYRCDRQSMNVVDDPDGGWQFQIDYRLMVQEAD